MARGYPDYFGFSVFPYDGAFTVQSLSGNLAPETSERVIDITTKGIVQGGWVTLLSIAATTALVVGLTIDGQLLVYSHLYLLWYRGFREYGTDPVFWLQHIPELGNYSLGFRKGYSFGYQFAVDLYNNSLTETEAYTGNFVYTKVL